MSMLNSEAKLFGLDLHNLVEQLRNAWQGLGQLPWLSRCMPVSRLRVVDINDPQPGQAKVRGSQRWVWDDKPQAQTGADAKSAYKALLLGSDQQLLRTLHLPSMPQAAIRSAMALDVQTMSPFSESETLWAYRIHTQEERERTAQASMPGLSLDLCITSRTLVQQALQQSAQAAETIEVWGGTRRMPILFTGFGEGRRLKHEARQSYWLWLAGLVMLALVLALALTPTAQLRLRAIDAAEQFQSLREETAPIAAKRQGMTAETQEMAQLQTQLHEQVNHLQVLAALAQAYPDDTAVQRIQFKGRQITIQGLSGNASNAVQIMTRTPGFTAVRMPSAVTKVPGTSKESFVVEAQIDTSALGLYPPPPSSEPTTAASEPTTPASAAQEPSR